MIISEELTDSTHHDLCFLSEACEEIEEPQHGYCNGQTDFCIHCCRECICERLRQAGNMATFATMHLTDVDSYNEGKREATAAAVQRVEELTIPHHFRMSVTSSVWNQVIGECIAAIKGDQP
jgi:hypothetical protein